MKIKKLLIAIAAFVLVCSLVQAADATLAYHWGWGLPADVNGDGKVDMRDISIIISLFNTNPSSPNWNPAADINLDGIVNMRDLNMALLEFNLYVKEEVDYQAIACNGPYPLAGATAKLFILSNNMFYASIQLAQIIPCPFAFCEFDVGQEGSGIQGAQDDRAWSFYYGEGWRFTGLGLGLPWYAKGYYYGLIFALPTQGWFQFEMWGTLSGTTTWTMLQISTGTGSPPFVDVDFEIVHY